MLAERLRCREVRVEAIDELFVGLSVQLVQGELVLLLNIFVLIFKLHLTIILLDLLLILINFHIMALFITISGPAAHMMLVLRVHVGHSLLSMVVLYHLMLMSLIGRLSLRRQVLMMDIAVGVVHLLLIPILLIVIACQAFYRLHVV